jgi:hypothetical protein
MRPFRILLVAQCALLALALASCSGPKRPPEFSKEAAKLLKEEKWDEAVAEYEKLIKEFPDVARYQLAIASIQFQAAQKAASESDTEEFDRRLLLATEPAIKAVELDPDDASGHEFLGIIATYQGDINRAIRSFENAHTLQPRNPGIDVQLAEAYIYKGDLARAYRHIGLARKAGMATPLTDFLEMVAAWRRGDMVEARDAFDGVMLTPQVLKAWNEYIEPEEIKVFEDFAESCCKFIACGVYMNKSCDELGFDPVQRTVTRATRERELQLELERRERLKTVYKERKELEVKVEDPAEISKQLDIKTVEEGEEGDAKKPAAKPAPKPAPKQATPPAAGTPKPKPSGTSKAPAPAESPKPAAQAPGAGS